MQTVPIKLIKSMVTAISENSWWTDDDGSGDPWIGFPYKWEMTLEITPQMHGSSSTQTPFQYDGLDIVPGMWFTTNSLFPVRINEIISQSPSTVVAIVEDVDRVNTFNDPYQSGGGAGQLYVGGYVFELDENDFPILFPVEPYYVDITFSTDLMSSFNSRKINRKPRFYQNGNDFEVGDNIFLDIDGLFKRVDPTNKDHISKMLGTVSRIDTPGLDWMNIDFRGEYKSKLDFSLPTSDPGSLIYLDPLNPGGLTVTKPTSNATPIYIRLFSDTEAVYLLGGSGGGSSDLSPPLGYYASVYRVANIAERDALPASQMNAGDQVFVLDAGENEWAHYIVSAKTTEPDTVTYTKLTDLDSSTTDAKTVSITVNYNGASPVNIVRLSPGSRVVDVSVQVTQPWNALATMSIGDDASNSRLVSNEEIDLSVTETFIITPSYQYGGTTETWVKAYFNPQLSVSGNVRITVSYI